MQEGMWEKWKTIRYEGRLAKSGFVGEGVELQKETLVLVSRGLQNLKFAFATKRGGVKDQ